MNDEEKIYKLIKRKPNITKRQLMEQTGFSHATVCTNINNLIWDNKVSRKLVEMDVKAYHILSKEYKRHRVVCYVYKVIK